MTDSAESRGPAKEREPIVELGIVHRLSMAVESMLFSKDMAHGMVGILLQIVPIRECELPTPELRAQFRRILDRLDVERLKAEERWLKKCPKPLSEYGEHELWLRFSQMSSPSKRWFKKEVWKFFSDCVWHNTWASGLP